MRVLAVGNMYPPHHLGGYELTWQAAMDHLREHGHEVRVLTTDFTVQGAGGDGGEPGVRRELRWYWRDHDFPAMSGRERLALERHNARVLERQLRELQPDVLNWWGMGGMSLSLVERVRRRGLPAMGVVGDDWMLYGADTDAWTRAFARRPRLAPLAERLSGVPARVDLETAALWLFNSERTRRRAGERWRFSRSRVAHPGVDSATFRAQPGRDWGWRLLYAGRIDERKGIATAIEALAELPPGATLRIVGDGDPEYARELRRLAVGRRVGVRVRLEPGTTRAALASAYADADALVFPVTWDEPWGLVPLEAMAVGRPVVATGTGGSGEYLRHERNCLLFPPRDVPSLVQALTRLAADADLRARLVRGGSDTSARFTQDAYNRAIADALTEVVS